MERKIRKSTTYRFKTVGAIHTFNVASGGIFSKGRSPMLDKLLLCPVTLYLLRKFAVLYFKLGKFFLGRFAGFLNYFHLLLDENDSLSEYVARLNRRNRSD